MPAISSICVRAVVGLDILVIDLQREKIVEGIIEDVCRERERSVSTQRLTSAEVRGSA